MLPLRDTWGDTQRGRESEGEREIKREPKLVSASKENASKHALCFNPRNPRLILSIKKTNKHKVVDEHGRKLSTSDH